MTVNLHNPILSFLTKKQKLAAPEGLASSTLSILSLFNLQFQRRDCGNQTVGPSHYRLKAAAPGLTDRFGLMNLVRRRPNDIKHYALMGAVADGFAAPVSLSLPNRCRFSGCGSLTAGLQPNNETNASVFGRRRFQSELLQSFDLNRCRPLFRLQPVQHSPLVR